MSTTPAFARLTMRRATPAKGLRLASHLRRDTNGNILPMTASAVLVLAALVGGGVDMSRAYSVQNRLQAACDAGVLAGRRTITTAGFDTTAQTAAQNYFKINFDEARQGTSDTSLTTTATNSDNTIVGTATTKMPMMVMQLFNKPSMTITAKCTSTMGIGNSDVTFVLDTTGSMDFTLPDGQTRLAALKTAVKNFYTTLQGTVAGTNARVRYSFVPYSASVNVGRALTTLNASYVSDRHGIQSRVPTYDTGTEVDYADYRTWAPTISYYYDSTYNSTPVRSGIAGYGSAAKCLAAGSSGSWVSGTPVTGTTTTRLRRNGRDSGSDDIPTSVISTPQTMQIYTCHSNSGIYYGWTYTAYRTKREYTYTISSAISETRDFTTFDHWDYRLVDVDTSAYKTFASVTTPTGSSGSNITTTWEGCIEERATTPTTAPSYNSLSNTITPTAALDLDIDSAPTSDLDTKWMPMWRELAYLRATSGSYFPYSATDTVLSNTGQSIYADGWTFCPKESKILQTWAQADFNTYIDALQAEGDTIHDIGLIWGARMSSPTGLWASTVNAAPPNSGNVGRHLIFMTDGQLQMYNYELSSWGVEIYDKRVTGDGTTDAPLRHESRYSAICDAIKARGIRVWVIAYTTSMSTALANCASPNSTYTTDTAGGINTAFQEIAKNIGELRISQ